MAAREPDQLAFIIADLDRYTRLEIITLGVNINANLRSSPPVGTPRDTGWAAANWVPSIGTPANVPGLPAGGRDPTPGDVTARATIAEKGLNEVLSWDHGDGVIFSTNNVPYIIPLNNGHSAQSPRGFVQAAMERAIRQTYSMAGNRAGRMARGAAFRARSGKPPRRGP